jgi:hypothetical protein
MKLQFDAPRAEEYNPAGAIWTESFSSSSILIAFT